MILCIYLFIRKLFIQKLSYKLAENYISSVLYYNSFDFLNQKNQTFLSLIEFKNKFPTPLPCPALLCSACSGRRSESSPPIRRRPPDPPRAGVLRIGSVASQHYGSSSGGERTEERAAWLSFRGRRRRGGRRFRGFGSAVWRRVRFDLPLSPPLIRSSPSPGGRGHAATNCCRRRRLLDAITSRRRSSAAPDRLLQRITWLQNPGCLPQPGSRRFVFSSASRSSGADSRNCLLSFV